MNGGAGPPQRSQVEEAQKEGSRIQGPRVGAGWQDAWLRGMLTDTSESESEEKYGRFAESGRWITELFGDYQQGVTTSRGECSGRETPGSS